MVDLHCRRDRAQGRLESGGVVCERDTEPGGDAFGDVPLAGLDGKP